MDTARCEVYGVPLGDPAKVRLAALAHRLRATGVSVDLAYGDRGMKGAMKGAGRSGARVALVLGDRDIEADEVGVKNLATGEQEAVPTADVVTRVTALLGRGA